MAVGIAKIDAAVLARAAGDGHAVPLQLRCHATTAVGAIAIAAVANTMVKCGLVVALGSRPLRRRLLLATLLILAAGLGSLAMA